MKRYSRSSKTTIEAETQMCAGCGLHFYSDEQKAMCSRCQPAKTVRNSAPVAVAAPVARVQSKLIRPSQLTYLMPEQSDVVFASDCK